MLRFHIVVVKAIRFKPTDTGILRLEKSSGMQRHRYTSLIELTFCKHDRTDNRRNYQH